MDFHIMKRKQLQALCKKHRIPANLSNLEMANRLTEFHKEEENPAMQAVIEEQEESVRKIESKDVVLSKKCKKVHFSPEHELIDFNREPVMKRRTRRNSVYHSESNCSVEAGESGETKNETEGRWGRTRRTGELKLMETELKQKKRAIKAVKCNDGRKVASAVESFDDEESEEGGAVRHQRVTRLRGKMAAEVVKNGSKRERKGADKIDEKEHQEEVVNNRSRVTRSRAQKLTEAPAVEEKRARPVGKNKAKVAAVRAETDDNAVGCTESLSKRVDSGAEKSTMGSDQIMKGNGKGLKEILLNKQVAGDDGTAEPQLLLRRSKREAKMVAESEVLTNVRKVKGSRKTSKSMASDGSEVNAEISQIDVNPEGKESIQKIRRSTRRKTMIQSGDLRGDAENGYPLSSLPQSDIVSEVCKDDKVVRQPMRVMRRSRHNASATDIAVENLDAEKPPRESCLAEKENDAAQKNTRSRRNTSKCGPLDKIGEDSNIHQENKVMKQPRGHVSGEDYIKSNNDPNSGTQSLEGSSSQKVLSATATGQSGDERKQQRRLGKSDMLDASSHHGSSRIKESLILDVQLSVSKDSESANSLCSENMISGVELTSITETITKEEEASVADIADSSCMNLINGEDLANSDRNAASKSTELEVEKGKVLSEVDVEESILKNITDMDNHDPEAQAYSPMEGSGCITKINDQVLEEGLDVENEGSAVTLSSAQSFLHGDQTDIKTDIKVAEDKADEHVQPCLRDSNSKDTSQKSGKKGVFKSCNISNGAELTFITENHMEKEEASIADSADTPCMNLINGEDLANSETNAACQRAEVEVEKVKLLLEFDVEESIEQNIADTDKNDAVAQVYSPIEDSGCITKINDQVLEALDVGEENLGETRSSTRSFVNADMEVAETEASGCVQPSLNDNNSEDTPRTSGKDGVFESCETRHHGDNVAEENEIFFDNGRASELAEGDGCLKEYSYPSDHFSEFNVPDLSNSEIEIDAIIVSPDRGNIPDECPVMHIAEHCYQAVEPIAICSNSRDVNPKRGYEDDHMTQKEDSCIYEGINSEVFETRDSESSKTKGNKSKCDEDGEFNLAELFNEEGRYEITERETFSGGYSDKDFTEQGMSHGSPSTAPTTMCNNTGDLEANLSAEVGESHNFNDKQLEITEAEERECMKSDKSSNSQETSPSTPSSVSETQGR